MTEDKSDKLPPTLAEALPCLPDSGTHEYLPLQEKKIIAEAVQELCTSFDEKKIGRVVPRRQS